jgi:PadR family transcriptional regulator
MDEQLKLGDFEGAILMSVYANGDNAYGVTIRQEADSILGKTAAIGAVYTTLDRLEKKGFVRSWEGDPDAKRGGRRKKYYAVEGAGLRALQQKAQAVKQAALVWANLGGAA